MYMNCVHLCCVMCSRAMFMHAFNVATTVDTLTLMLSCDTFLGVNSGAHGDEPATRLGTGLAYGYWRHRANVVIRQLRSTPSMFMHQFWYRKD